MTTPPLLTVTDLDVDYRLSRTRSSRAVTGIGFEIGRGELVSLVGESGSGKSTTAHAVLGLLGDRARITRGSIRFDGTELTTLRDKQWRTLRGARIGFVPQDPTVSLNPTRRIGEQIAQSITLHEGRVPKTVLDDRVVALLTKVGIDRPALRARQYPHQLSGGMRQRALIANALAGEPELIVADEPTSALDVTVQKQILDHLDELRRELGIAILLITHDLGVAGDRSDRIVVLESGRVAESGPARQLLTDPQADYTRRLLAAVPHIDSGRLRAPATSTPATSGPATGPLLEKAPAAILIGSGLHKTFHESGTDVHAVHDVSISVRRGRTLGVVGESGSGKSTLARILTRLTDADSGTVEFDGRDVTPLKGGELRELRRHIQLVYQNPFASLDPRFTIGRTLTEPLRAFGIGTRQSRPARVAELLDLVGLPTSFADRTPDAMSGGQRQRVAIARALATDPSLVVLDEAVSALDVSVQAQILDLLVRIQAELGVSYLFISHDLAVIRQISDDIVVMRRGRVVEAGTADRVYTTPAVDYTRDLLAAVPGAHHPRKVTA
ncbi:dipeptide ABC transporter ATP-binding protein [Rhodococcus rhodochrous]|uniref:dipeptide ABC transporter ATP-binding protein n=1 Tax=Rhodococcus rhodochrous TaxID=1829 RepID=UPI001E61A89A|nr:ABC transporter ATP-binding protein [Rhodococcus rhodochrous]MCD2100231.1 ABC transporter ATP-binding protein [Rhodococcus rhodochrous]MCD2124567.1 ABC transporter ATP-binding protein [Rhodococcus rhodochrous]MCQ4137603.1 ABC transporter ATP-binding protein [Rhodococcus rhodochrous]MDJ0021385.1 ABC transporter ATP-binding protein [Rhodococcus rhodochrous]